MRIVLNWPGHACHTLVFEAEKSVRGYSFVGVRPFDPEEPVAEPYRRFYQLVPPNRAQEFS